MKEGKWQKIAICKCGWKHPCSFGDLFHLIYDGQHIDCCPSCGEHKHASMSIKIAREKYEKTKWYLPKRFSGWEIK